MSSVLLAVVTLIALHNVDGDEIMINPEHIAVLQITKETQGKGKNKLVASGHKCVVILDNGRVIGVIEDCRTIRQAIREAKREDD